MKVAFSTALVGVIIGIPTFILGWLGYRRSLKVDKSAAQQAVATGRSSEVQQIIDGLNGIIDNLQEDNLVWRDSFKSLTDRLGECVKAREDLQRQLRELRG